MEGCLPPSDLGETGEGEFRYAKFIGYGGRHS